MEIMRQGRVILDKRPLPYSTSTSVSMASNANPRPRLPRRATSNVRPASFAHLVRPRAAHTTRPAATARPRVACPPQPAAPVRPQASTPAQSFTPTLLQSIPSPTTYVPGRGLGQRANVHYASPAFREASQAARQARSVNDRSGQDAPTSSRRRVRLPSEDSDSDDQPLTQRLHRRALDAMPDSGPSTVPPSPPTATPTSVPSQAEAPPAPPNIQVEPPLAQPSTSQQRQSNEVGPSDLPSLVTPPPEPPQDVPTSSLKIKGRLATLWEESLRQMDSLPPAQMEKFSELYIKIEGLQEERSQAEVVHQQHMDQQSLEHQRAIDQLTQKLRAAEALAQEQDQKLKSQATQLTSQEVELLAARTELAQARATAEGVSTTLTIYKVGEDDRCRRSHDLYLRSPEFCTQAG
ncbi:carbohydrate-responsive element-binding protein-like [Zingiber officinale]|uniref:carbohydrate-responsive element-binding protein-like n=1 Tax=Zingiber officinale TaxID=94328 RepID=UPI001C4A894C|nr:carbohydrate-responsive element-binding protein-like [Zingiber officinale]